MGDRFVFGVVVVVGYEVWVSGSCFVVGGKVVGVGKWVFDDVRAAVYVGS